MDNGILTRKAINAEYNKSVEICDILPLIIKTMHICLAIQSGLK